LFHSAFEESEKSWGVVVAPAVKGLSHRLESLRNGVQIFRAVESSFFEVVEKALMRSEKN
jgi:hypothetical protein